MRISTHGEIKLGAYGGNPGGQSLIEQTIVNDNDIDAYS
jgi:hypothetical protein